MIDRREVLRVARSWIGTPFKHQGRTKGREIDCVGLPLMVSIELGVEKDGLRPDMFGPYPAQPIARAAAVRKWCEQLLTEKPIAKRQPGDVLAIRLPMEPCHCAILSELDLGRGLKVESIIHAYPLAHVAIEHILDRTWLWRVDGCFEFPGVLPWQ